MEFEGPSASEHLDSFRQNQPSVESLLLVIDKLVEEVKWLAIGGGLELVQYMQAMMTKVLTNVGHIRVQ